MTVLLRAGNTIKEIAKVASLDRNAVTEVARTLDIEPSDKTQKRAKQLFASDEGLTYAQVAARLRDEKLKNEGQPVHYLTVATWVANYGWPWGGSDDGHYSPDRTATSAAKSKYTLRMSRKMADEVNSAANIAAAAEAAWAALEAEETAAVAIAVIKGAAAVGVTDIGAVKSELMKRHGDTIRTAKR